MPRPMRRRDDEDDDFDDPRPRRRRREPQPAGIHPGLIIGGVAALVLLVAVGAVAVWLVARGRPADTARNTQAARAPASVALWSCVRVMAM